MIIVHFKWMTYVYHLLKCRTSASNSAEVYNRSLAKPENQPANWGFVFDLRGEDIWNSVSHLAILEHFGNEGHPTWLWTKRPLGGPNPQAQQVVCRERPARMVTLVLGKFGLVRFEPFLAKPETEWFGFSQDLPKPNLNRLKPFQIGLKLFETD